MSACQHCLAPSWPVPLCAVVEKGLEKNRARRWQTARQFSSALGLTTVLLDEPPPLTRQRPSPDEQETFQLNHDAKTELE